MIDTLATIGGINIAQAVVGNPPDSRQIFINIIVAVLGTIVVPNLNKWVQAKLELWKKKKGLTGTKKPK
jgi:hypothetical protein